MIQDTTIIKNKIVNFLENNGPSLPVHIAKHVETNMLFASAFLSELLSEQKIKVSDMKVGSSPIYYIKKDDERLEKFSEYLKSKEKEAYQRLKEKKFLKDEKEHPAIRVALREIKDFAKPLEKNNKLVWRYYTTQESEYLEQKTQVPQSIISEVKETLSRKESPHTIIPTLTPKDIPLKEIKKDKKKSQKKPTKKKTNTKDEKFFNTVKEHLTSQNQEITGIIGFNKESLLLKIKDNGNEKLIIAYNKKRIGENEIIKSHKKAQEYNLKYKILSFGEPLKKTSNLIDAIRDLDNLEKIE